MSKTRLGILTKEELVSFDGLRLVLNQPTTLIPHNPNGALWIDLNNSKEFGFGLVAFHIVEEILHKIRWLFSTFMQPILFLSRLLTIAKKNCWPTKLKITGFLSVIKNLRHLVEYSHTSVII